MDDRHFGWLHHKIPKKDHWETPELDQCFFLFWRNFAIFLQRNWNLFLEFSCFFSVNSTIFSFFFWVSFAKNSIPKNEKMKKGKKKKKNPGLQTPDDHQQNLAMCMHESRSSSFVVGGDSGRSEMFLKKKSGQNLVGRRIACIN
jgi:hypothetical protein